MYRWLIAIGLTGAACATPPGYEFIRITDTPTIEWFPRLNAHGDVVFAQRFGRDGYSDEIMLYRDGQITRLTDDDILDTHPQVADDGCIYWARGIGPEGPWGPTLEIVHWRDGVVERLTDNEVDDAGPKPNNVGTLVWEQYLYDGCSGANVVALLSDGEQTIEITPRDSSYQPGDINDHNEVVITDYDFCQNPWMGAIMHYRDGELEYLTDYDAPQQSADINNLGVIMWGRYEDGDENLYVYDHGERHLFSDGITPEINDHGDVFFVRYESDSEHYQAWAYLRGEFYRLSPDNEFNANGDMNNRTDICWMNRNSPKYDIVMLKRLPFGDMNCDKRVNFDDIDGFVLALTAGKDEFQKTYPDCDWWLADMNDDRSIDFNDIDPFVNCLINGGCER